jgi:hypothetical protein
MSLDHGAERNVKPTKKLSLSKQNPMAQYHSYQRPPSDTTLSHLHAPTFITTYFCQTLNNFIPHLFPDLPNPERQ